MTACVLCDGEPVVGVNGAAYCVDHATDGFVAAARGFAVARGVTSERQLDAIERAMLRELDGVLERDLELGEIVELDVGLEIVDTFEISVDLEDDEP